VFVECCERNSTTTRKPHSNNNNNNNNNTLSKTFLDLVATSSNELVFFAGGYNSTGQPSDRVDIYNMTSGSWTTTTHTHHTHTLSLFLVLFLQQLPHKILSSLVEVAMEL
jgi:hypothetical protein